MADTKHNTDDWISLCEARALVTRLYLSAKFAADWLLKRLENGQLRWRYWGCRAVGLSPPSTADGPINGDPAFWQGSARIEVFWDESWARLTLKSRLGLDLFTRRVVKSWQGVELFKIEVARADILALLPTGTDSKELTGAGPIEDPSVVNSKNKDAKTGNLAWKKRAVKALLRELYPPNGLPDAGPQEAFAHVAPMFEKRNRGLSIGRDTVRNAIKDILEGKDD